jgi:hypothetical protein
MNTENKTKLDTVDTQVVATFSETKDVSTSYMQESKHAKVTDKFVVIQPASVGNILADNGFKLVSQLTSKGRKPDMLDFQRTISRYRANDAFEIDGCALDLIHIGKHMGRGCDEFRLGLFRGVCANQWAVGTLFELVKFRHTGDVHTEIQAGLVQVLSQRSKLVGAIQAMQARQMTGSEIEQLAKDYAAIRLEGKENIIDADWKMLTTQRRTEDSPNDLWTIANRLQENVVRAPLQYRIQSNDSNGVPTVRNMRTQKFKESSAQLVDLNGKLFDKAMQLAA